MAELNGVIFQKYILGFVCVVCVRVCVIVCVRLCVSIFFKYILWFIGFLLSVLTKEEPSSFEDGQMCIFYFIAIVIYIAIYPLKIMSSPSIQSREGCRRIDLKALSVVLLLDWSVLTSGSFLSVCVCWEHGFSLKS